MVNVKKGRRLPVMSVVIPCSAKGELAGNTIKRLPDHEDTEILVVLSNADAETRSVVAQCARLRGNVVIVDQGAANVGQARNQGLDASRGEYVMFLDADILLDPEAIPRRIYLHRNTPRPKIIGALIEGYDIGYGQADYREALLQPAKNGLRTFASAYPWLHANCAAASSPRASLLPAQGVPVCFDQAFSGWGGEDQEWALRLHCFTDIAIDAGAHATHQPHPRDMGLTVRQYRRNLRYFIQKYPSSMVECLAVFGCRYAEAAATELDGLRTRHGSLVTFTDDSCRYQPPPSDLYGLFLPLDDQVHAAANVNGDILARLPKVVTEHVLGEARRVTRAHMPVQHHGDCRPQPVWDSLVSDFILSARECR